MKCQQNADIYGKIREELKKRCTSRGENLCFTVDQLRSNFKKCVYECKRAALTIKTGTGIKRFQEDKSYGSWFQKLYEVAKTRDSCQPDQAIEPRAMSSIPTVPSEDTSESEVKHHQPTKAMCLYFSNKQSEKAIGMIQFVKL